MIDGKKLKLHRERRRWSREDLAREARGVSAKTIYRLEADKQAIEPRRNTVEKLAAALRVDPAALTRNEDQPASMGDFERRSKMTVSSSTQNAAFLMGLRYRVNPIDIIEMAPLLFHLVAEQSLKERREALAKVLAQLESINHPPELGHLRQNLTSSGIQDLVVGAEERSIRNRDIFGDTLDDDEDAYDEVYPFDYDPDQQNPFVAFLKRWIEAVSSGAVAEICDRRYGLAYSVGYDEADELFGGDEDAGHFIVSGAVGIDEVPPDLLEPDTEPAARAAWVRELGTKRQMELSDLLLGI